MNRTPLRLMILCLILRSLVSGLPAQAQDAPYDLLYSEYISPAESYLIRHPVGGKPEIFLTIEYPGSFDALLYSPLNGLYYIFDNQAYLNQDRDGAPLFYFPLTESLDHLREITVNIEAFPDQGSSVIVNSATLSHNEQFMGLDMTTLDEMGRAADEFIAVYAIASQTLRIIEVENPDILSNRTIDNVRWSPDDTTLAYFYPTDEMAATEHITLVTGCTPDITAECQIERLQLPPEAPVMESFDWSPDGTRLAVSCADDHLAADWICIISAGGAFETKYTTSAETHKSGLEWSPDGRWIAYTGQNPSYTQQDIYVLDLETGEETNVSDTNDALESLPLWVKSGQ